MRCFKFVVRSNSSKRERAWAHVWVNEKDLVSAESQARTLLRDKGWIVESIELSMAPTADEIARLDPLQAAAHKRAQAAGIDAYFSPL
jgi:hypothetical protein